jgi:methylthioribose-1-phosphate isomerase
MWQLINQLSVRGAPMIGVAAAMCLASVAIKGILVFLKIVCDVFTYSLDVARHNHHNSTKCIENNADKVKTIADYLKTSRYFNFIML